MSVGVPSRKEDWGHLHTRQETTPPRSLASGPNRWRKNRSAVVAHSPREVVLPLHERSQMGLPTCSPHLSRTHTNEDPPSCTLSSGMRNPLRPLESAGRPVRGPVQERKEQGRGRKTSVCVRERGPWRVGTGLWRVVRELFVSLGSRGSFLRSLSRDEVPPGGSLPRPLRLSLLLWCQWDPTLIQKRPERV